MVGEKLQEAPDTGGRFLWFERLQNNCEIGPLSQTPDIRSTAKLLNS